MSSSSRESDTTSSSDITSDSNTIGEHYLSEWLLDDEDSTALMEDEMFINSILQVMHWASIVGTIFESRCFAYFSENRRQNR